jgi:uncharacterized short protein YbdD (DUF466 family)
MQRAYRKLKQGLRSVWQGLREWSGDAAYETYVQCTTRRAGNAPLTREEFYVDQLKRKYSRPSRCC